MLREKNQLEMQCAARVREAETRAAVLQTRNDEMRRRLDDNDARIQEAGQVRSISREQVRQKGEMELVRAELASTKQHLESANAVLDGRTVEIQQLNEKIRHLESQVRESKRQQMFK